MELRLVIASALVMATGFCGGACMRIGFEPAGVIGVSGDVGTDARDGGADQLRDAADGGRDGAIDRALDTVDETADLVADAGVDASADQGADAPADQGADTLVDQGPDHSVDLVPLADLASDAAVAACDPGTAVFSQELRGVVFCEALTPLTQCTAEAACSAAEGWGLCQASAFAAAFSFTAPAPPSGAWIGGCVREVGAPHLPTDGPCQCFDGSATPVAISWDCVGGPTALSTAAINVGVRSNGVCRKVGKEIGPPGVFWEAEPASHGLSLVACCRL